MITVYYFGCLYDPCHGHSTYRSTPGGAWKRIVDTELLRATGLSGGDLDGRFAPRDPRRYYDEAPEGAAAIRHCKYIGVPWTVVSWWDRSVDTRPGSSSTFVILGHWTFDEAVRLAREAFPERFARQTFEVRLFDAEEKPHDLLERARYYQVTGVGAPREVVTDLVEEVERLRERLVQVVDAAQAVDEMSQNAALRAEVERLRAVAEAARRHLDDIQGLPMTRNMRRIADAIDALDAGERS